jgi:hypothetical protein
MAESAARRAEVPQGTLGVLFHFSERSNTTLANTTQATTNQADKPVSDTLYKAEYVGSGTFIISKPKRKETKRRQSNLKNVRRGSRK